MLPGIVSSYPIYGNFPLKKVIREDTPVQLIYNERVDNINSGLVSLNIGEDFNGRFLIFQAITTSSTTQPGLSFQVNGQGYSLRSTGSASTPIGRYLDCILVVPGDSFTFELSHNSLTSIVRICVWLIGSPDKPCKLVEWSDFISASSTTDSLSIPLTTSLLRDDTKVISLTGARPLSTGNTFDENWLSPQVTDLATQAGQTMTTQISLGSPPEDATSVTVPSSTSSIGKAGRLYQVRQADSMEDIPYDPVDSSLIYRFVAGHGCYRDLGGSVPCADGQRIAKWLNRGSSSQDAVQTNPARRPVFKTGGYNGKSYVECLRDNRQFFEDLLDIPQPSGVTNLNPYTVSMVLELYDTDFVNPILGNPDFFTQKNSVFVRTTGQFQAFKNQFLTSPITPNTPVVITLNVVDFAEFNYLVNGNPLASIRSTTNPSSNQNVITQFLRSIGTENSYFHGRLYEIMIHHNKTVPFHDFNPRHASLMQKYGLLI